MEVEFSGCIQKSGAQTLNRNISKTIQVPQTIYTAFKRASGPHWFRTLRQKFARVVSLLAFQHVSKHSEATLTQC